MSKRRGPQFAGKSKYGARRALACRTCGVLVEKAQAAALNVLHRETNCTGEPVEFDSKAEARTWLKLCEAEDAGYIRELERQRAYPIHVNGVRVGVYRADFVFLQSQAGHDRERGPYFATVERVIDVKGHRTPLYRFKKRCVEAEHGIVIEEWSRGATAL
jgi:hypothetical protein